MTFFSQQKSVKNISKLPLKPLEPLKHLKPLEPRPIPIDNFSPNTIVQRQLYINFQKNKDDLYEYNNLLKAATSSGLCLQFTSKIKQIKDTIIFDKKKLKKLKGNAEA